MIKLRPRPLASPTKAGKAPVQKADAPAPAKPKRSHHKKKSAAEAPTKPKPKLPNLDPNDARIWQETAQLAQEGNTKLARAIDALRECLQTLVEAEMDFTVKPPQPVQAHQLRALAAEGLEAYSDITGQNWRMPRNRVVRTRAGVADGRLDKNTGNDGGDYD